MLQNATPLRKSARGPPNSSDEDVSRTAPATENASLQILFKCPTPAIVCGNDTKPSRFAHFWEGAQSLAPATRNDIWTSKSGANMWCTFWLRNVLRATTACTFSTSQLPKVVRTWCVLYILTSKCASCHNGVHFFDISTSKSGPDLVCFVHFDFEMCFAPQRRALFRHLNFQRWSGAGVFCTFWLRNVLRATACNFSSLIWLRTRRLSEPTFRPSRATNHWKNRVFRDFPTFARTCVFFLLTLSLLWSSLFYSSLLSDSSHLCFSSVNIVRTLPSKLPSINIHYIIINQWDICLISWDIASHSLTSQH